MTPDVRTVLGVTAEGWTIGLLLFAVIVICCDELGRFLASLSAVRVRVPERRSSIPAYRVEAEKARSGMWGRP